MESWEKPGLISTVFPLLYPFCTVNCRRFQKPLWEENCIQAKRPRLYPFQNLKQAAKKRISDAVMTQLLE